MSGVTAQRFSQVYLESGGLTKDSARMRRRLGKCVERCFPRDKEADVGFGHILEDELGIEVIQKTPYGKFVRWVPFFEKAELRDVLDTLNLALAPCEMINGTQVSADMWERFKRIVAEERVGFVLDDIGGVHPFVDPSFESGRVLAVEALRSDKYAAARGHLNSADQALLNDPPDGRAAIQHIFDVVENIFKQSFEGETHINKTSINKRLPPMIEKMFEVGSTEVRVSHKLMNSFSNWVDCAHFYRHEAGKQEPSQPPAMIRTVMIADGYSKIRWLAQLVEG